jgi:hypothetical protein
MLSVWGEERSLEDMAMRNSEIFIEYLDTIPAHNTPASVEE